MKEENRVKEKIVLAVLKTMDANEHAEDDRVQELGWNILANLVSNEGKNVTHFTGRTKQ